MTDRTTPLIIAEKAPETMKIASDETGLGYMIINASDFDASSMKVFAEKAEKPSKKASE